MANVAKQNWELANNVQEESDDIYVYDEAKNDEELSKRGWDSDPKFFKKVKISAVAVLKMVMHARSGVRPEGDLEVMGILQGKLQGNTMIVMDTFALPVKQSAIQVNPMVESYEYIVNYIMTLNQVGRLENALGWYHSHPGYGCWFSTIDVNTQLNNQQYMEPFLGIVIDPKRTMSSGKVDIGAFRTYPRDYTPEGTREYQSIPLEMIEDFGVNCNKYYQLEISVFKSSLDSKLFDLLWNKYWVNTLSSSPLLNNKAFSARRFSDLAEKLEKAEGKLSNTRFGYFLSEKKKEEESQLSKVTKDSSKATIEHLQGVISQVIKYNLFQ
jgi:COP9 signalosome complex subunit 5